MPKGHYDHKPRGNKKAEILDAATKVYAHYGFEGATLQRMAEEAGVTRPLITKYFGTKEGLVRAVTDRAIQDNLKRLAAFDEIPGLTLRQRSEKQFEHLMITRGEWCLVVGTLLVPTFQFAMRGEAENYLQTEYQAVQRHREEFQTPQPEVMLAYAYADVCMQIGFIVGGKIDSYKVAQRVHQNSYLLPEQEILAKRKSTPQT